MNKAVIYFGATGNEAADQMVMQVLEEYCTVNGYEVVAVISENARPEGMTFPMKFALSGLSGKNLLFGRGLHIWHYWRRSLVLWRLPYYMLIVS